MGADTAPRTRDIFFLSNSVNELGGITTWSHQMARLFSDRGHRVHMLGIAPPPQGREQGLADGLPYKTTTLYETRPPSIKPVRGLTGKLNIAARRRSVSMREQATKLTALFRAAPPDTVAIVTQVWAMEWAALSDTSRITVVGMSHESFETCRKSSRFRRVQQYYKHVDRMLTLTREDADHWIRLGMNNAGFMPNPLPFFPPTPSLRQTKTVATVGRLHWEKGIDLLLEAWAHVTPHYPDWKLRIYGTGEEEDTLQQQCAALGLDTCVEWRGPTSDVPAALHDSSVFVLSSRGEGFPLTLMEAMAAAVPCVAFDVAPGVREIIANGQDGLLASPGNPTELARQLSRLLADKEMRDQMGTTARNNIQRYSADRILTRWEELFTLLEK
ncbi:glycosyltransferase [Streptomyces netropsis]|uniref:glycosyltransferase n=1 Tax=Streptomyces netropsis TaxID=55404 RepID=UPI00378E7002